MQEALGLVGREGTLRAEPGHIGGGVPPWESLGPSSTIG